MCFIYLFICLLCVAFFEGPHSIPPLHTSLPLSLVATAALTSEVFPSRGMATATELRAVWLSQFEHCLPPGFSSTQESLELLAVSGRGVVGQTPRPYQCIFQRAQFGTCKNFWSGRISFGDGHLLPYVSIIFSSSVTILLCISAMNIGTVSTTLIMRKQGNVC